MALSPSIPRDPVNVSLIVFSGIYQSPALHWEILESKRVSSDPLPLWSMLKYQALGYDPWMQK